MKFLRTLLPLLYISFFSSAQPTATVVPAPSAPSIKHVFDDAQLSKIERLLPAWENHVAIVEKEVATYKKKVSDAQAIQGRLQDRLGKMSVGEQQKYKSEWDRVQKDTLKAKDDLAVKQAELANARQSVVQRRMILREAGRYKTITAVNQSLVATGHRRANPLRELSLQTSHDWNLGDGGLEIELRFALRDAGLMQEVLKMRQKNLSAWQEWQAESVQSSRDADKKREHLHKQMMKDIKAFLKKRVAETVRDKALAQEAVDAHLSEFVDQSISVYGLGDTTFVDTMVKSIMREGAGVDNHYRHLFLMVLGCADLPTSEYYKKEVRAIRKKGSPLSDYQCMRQVFARIIVTYRAEYDKRYEGLLRGLSGQLVRENPAAKQWVAQWKKDEYLATQSAAKGAEEQAAYDAWMAQRAEKSTQAHQGAYDAVNGQLSYIWEVMQSIHARLDVLRVASIDVGYPSKEMAPHDRLEAGQVYSVLLGMLCRLVYEKLVKGVPIESDHHVVQQLFNSEMAAQQRAFHIPRNIPSRGEDKGLPAVHRAALEVSYQAKMFTIADASMNVFRGHGGMHNNGHSAATNFFIRKDKYLAIPLAGALANSNFDVPAGSAKYAQLLMLYGELNALRWGLPATKTQQEVMSELHLLSRQIETFLTSIKIPVSDAKANITNVYSGILQRLVIWPKSASITFEKPASIYPYLGKIDGQPQNIQAYQATYQLMWLCIWQRVRMVLAGSSGSGHALIGEEHAKPFTDDTLPIAGANDDAATGEEQLDELKQGVVKVGEAFKGLPQHLKNMARRMTSHAAGVKQGVLDFANDGSLPGLFRHVGNILDETGSLLPGINTVLGNVYDSSDTAYNLMHNELRKQSDKLLATLKALITYIHVISKYSGQKIDSLKRGLDDILNSGIVRVAARVGSLTAGKKIRSVIGKQMSDEDKQLVGKMESAQYQIVSAWQGKIEPGDVKGFEEIV